MADTAELIVKMDPEVKEQAESILAALGISASNAVNLFYKQIILQRGLPFEVKLPYARPPEISALTGPELDAELEKGYADLLAGRSRGCGAAFAAIRRDYGL